MEQVTKLINKYSDQFEINTAKRMAAFLGQIGTETVGFKSLREGSCFSEKAIKSNFGKVGKTYRKYCDLFVGYNIVRDDDCPNNKLSTCSKQLSASVSLDSLKVKSIYICSSSLFDYVYACRMGNGAPSSKDGSTYNGKGFIQLTGKDMYKAISNAWNSDPTNNVIMEFHGKDINKLVKDLEIAMKASLYYWQIKKYRGQSANNISDDSDIVSLTLLVNGGKNGLAERISYYNKAIKILDNNKYEK